jgi:hypothetical protein
MVNFPTSKNTEKLGRRPGRLPEIGQKFLENDRKSIELFRLPAQKVNTVARYLRSSTTVPFILLMDLNRVLPPPASAAKRCTSARSECPAPSGKAAQTRSAARQRDEIRICARLGE